MRAGGAEPATARSRVEPPGRDGGRDIRNERHVLDERHDTRRADRAVADGAPDDGALWCPPKLVTDEMGHAGHFRGREHGLGLGRVQRERLLAEHVHACRCSSDRELRVRGRWRGDRDRVDVAELEGGIEIRDRTRDARPLGTPRRLLRVPADQRSDLEPRGTQCRDVDATTEPRTDDDGSGHAQ